MKKKTPRQHVKSAIFSGNKEKIQTYMKKYFSLQFKEKRESITAAKKIFS